VADGQVRATWRHFSFLGADTLAAGAASECAADQGKFWEYHDRLFEAQPERKNGAFATAQLKAYGVQVGLEAPAFNACVDGGRYVERVKAETERGRAKGVKATPTLFVNGRKIEGVPQPEALDALIATALRAGKLPIPGA
jgi:protein-disulfide isomerase